jgi:hypothetical protein
MKLLKLQGVPVYDARDSSRAYVMPDQVQEIQLLFLGVKDNISNSKVARCCDVRTSDICWQVRKEIISFHLPISELQILV